MNIDYIVVQAGGRGSRLGYLTKNKPKALVPVENLPILFHLFRKYPDKKYVIIADYHKEVLREYLASFAKVTYQVVDAEGTGTCSGIRQAIALLPNNTPFMLVWSDLILPRDLTFPKEEKDYIGISQTFPCRWSYQNGKLMEEKSTERGVAGLFLFTEKAKLQDVPVSGELVRWLGEKKFIFGEIGLAGTKEFGLLEEYNKLAKERCRPFNKMTFEQDVVIKEAISGQGKELAERECAWYEAVREKNITILPEIYGTHPLRMERIHGKNIYECGLTYEQKLEILQKLVDALKTLHKAQWVPTDTFSMKEAYYNKTMQRLARIRDLIPFADRKAITINGKICHNVYFYKRQLEKALEQLHCSCFCLIHGDCTFSNLMLREDGTPVLIDPRGYFGHTEIFGDPRYDWAKLYYSLSGNYDRFNLKDFRMNIGENEITLQIASNHWEDLEEAFFQMTEADKDEIKLLHAVIWLSLTTYAWQDYDSICGAFYNGLYYLEDVL